MTAGPIEAATAVCRDLVDRAEAADHGLTWRAEIVVGVDGDAPVLGHGDIGTNLYDGTAGVALALASLIGTAADPGGDGTLATTVRGAARHALAGAPDLLAAGLPGYWDGACGIAYAAAVAARKLDDDDLRRAAAALARDVAHVVSEGDGSANDLISGDAGAALGLASLADELALEELLTSAQVAAARLVDTARPQVWGAAWGDPTDPEGPPLLGLGHGAAGIALALGELAASPGAPAGLEDACAQALAYERGWYDPDRRAWPDLRGGLPQGEPTGWTTAWCHGGIGIGLSRLRLAVLTPGPRLLAEATAALQAARDLAVSAGTALHGGAAGDCSSCHGLGGVVELYTVAARALGSAEHAAAARRVATMLVAERDVSGAWPCGLPGAGEVPGLMTGTAGIALALARAVGATPAPTPLLPGPGGW
ncbi:lanthionine synthetase LanC family protein [Oceanitalea stevensii]|uniref:Uncharacterized protein n=1 Tax=Oceanitalea stevensii TaxID=2763072 RepID=A0ABR8YZY1_9MICO|nr:lanthionine synthetase LanC family protein [Oceanitalea stevensii]MBD8061348.1 hypothetical protein [Oceanitalea stevensii]